MLSSTPYQGVSFFTKTYVPDYGCGMVPDRVQMPTVAILVAVLFGLVADAGSALGYNEDGHFYTVTAVEHDRQPAFEGGSAAEFKAGSREEAVVTAFCAQLPDLSSELDATTLRVNVIFSVSGTFWGAFSFCWGEDVRHMVAVHRYLHGLTDTAAQPVTDAAVAIIKTLRGEEKKHADLNTACAIGFAVHLLGDSFAHRQLYGSTAHMYAPGFGHFRDNHDPDYIDFTEARMKLWETYAKTLSRALEINFDQGRWNALQQVVETNRAGGTENNQFHTNKIIDALTGTLNGDGGIQVWAKYNPPVEKLYAEDSWIRQHVLSLTFGDVVTKYEPPYSANLKYGDVWKTYERVAVEEFKKFKELSEYPVCPPDLYYREAGKK